MLATDLEAPHEHRRRKETCEKTPTAIIGSWRGRKANSRPAPEITRKVNFAPGRRKVPLQRFAARRRSNSNAAAVGRRELAI